MAHRSQCSSAGDNPLDPNYLPPHYREEYRMAIDALVEADLEGYYGFLKKADVVDFLSCSEIEYIKCMVQAPHHIAQPERRYMAEDVDGSSDTYWPVHSDHDAPSLDLGWPQQFRFIGPTEVTTLVNPSDPEMPSIKEQVRRMIKNAQQVIAVVMDMFTDVDIFADILGAATRGVAVYVLLDELNAHHFVAMVNNCRVNLDEIKFMRVRTVSGSTYHCRTGKTFKGRMMDRFILVDCRAVLSGNYSFMWSFEKIHRCLAHLFLGQLVTTFDEEFRILFAHSEPLVVENVLANMQHSSGEPGSYYNTEKTHMFNRDNLTMGMELAGRTTEDSLGYKMLPFRSESIHSAAEANPSIQRNMNLHADQQYRGNHQFIEHGRQMRGPNDRVGSIGHSSENIPDYEYMPPENHLTIRGKQYMEGAIPHVGHFAQEPCIHKGAGLQSGYDMYGRYRGQGQHIDQFSGPVYPHEVDKDEPPGAYDHIQRYLQSQPAMEEGHGPRNLIPPVQSNLKRHSMGHSYTCQTSPTQPNPPEQKHFFNVNRKAQDVSQKQGMRDWRISSYLSAYDDPGELDLAELEGSTACDDIPCFTQEAPCGPIRPEIRLGNREFNRIPSPRENTMFAQIQNNSIMPDSSVNHPYNLSQINIKTTPASTSESSCTTEGDKVEETQNREHKETSRISEEFLRRKPNRQVQRSSRLRHSLIFSSNLELHASEEMKDTGEEKDVDEASKLSARVSQIMDKRRTGSPFQPFQWSSLAKSATFDNSASESAQPEDKLNKMGETSDVDKVEICRNLRKNSLQGDLQEKDLAQTVPETNSQRDECPSNLLQKSSSFIDMNDPDSRLRYFKELAAKRKLAAAKASQSNPMKATHKFTLPEKPLTIDADKKSGHVFKIPETPLKSKNTSVTEIKETYKDTKCEESSKDILHRATDAEKIRFKKQLAEKSGSSLKNLKGDIDQALKEEARTVSTAKNQTPPILNIVSQKPFGASQNQVISVALDNTSTESGLNQYHIPKETDPSHAIATESGLPMKLPQTKCVSSLHTTTNEGSLSANDLQTLAQNVSNISSTCSDTVPLDSNSTANHATVDTCVPSKNDHKDTVPSPAFLHTPGNSSNKHPTAIKADSSQHLNETGADISKHSTTVGAEPSTVENVYPQHHSVTEKNSSHQHTLMEADSSKQPITTESKPSQKSTSPEADSSQHTPASNTDCFQQSAAVGKNVSLQPSATESGTSKDFPITTETDSFQQPTAAKRESSHHSTTIKVDSSQHQMETDIPQKSNAVETDSSQQPTATATDSSQQPTATEIDSSQQPTATETGSSQQPTATETGSSQQPTPTETDSSQQPTATETDSSQQPTATNTDFSQQPTATENDSSQQPTATETDSSQQSTTTERDSSQQPTATKTHCSQQPTATETDSSQQPTATKTDSSQQPNATETDSSQQPTATKTDSSQQPTETETGSFHQPTATETDSSQQPTATETGSSHQPTATETDSSQQPTATERDSSQQPTATETDSSQQPTATETDSSQQPTATETDSSQQPTATETDSSQQPTATETDSSQQPTATETDSSQQPTATETDSSHQPTAAVTDSSQQPIAKETDPSQCPIASETDSSQHPTAKETDPSQQPTATDKDASQQPTATVTDSSDTDFSHQPIVTETESSPEPTAAVTNISQKSTSTVTDSFQKNSVTATNSFQKSVPTETDSSQHLSITESELPQNPTKMETDTSKHPIETKNESLKGITAKNSDCMNEKKDENLSEGLIKLIPIPEANNTQKENSISQNEVTTVSCSPAKHSQSETVTPCGSQVELNETQASAKPCITPTVKDADNGALTSLDSVEVCLTSQGSPESCLSSNEINSTQGKTQLQSSFSSNSMQSSCQNDSKPEKTDECQKSDSITEQNQSHDPSPVDAGPNIAHIEVSTATDSNEVDKMKQTTPQVENTVTNLAEVSEKSHLTVHSNLENQSSIAENAKSKMSAHQTSTANVISCSNLRDDTKVLLEQISAKNQSRSSQSKQTLDAPNEAKKVEVRPADNLFSNYSGRPWSSKATPEEREMLLQKMEQMRKQRKVYSRFEAS
ncbi:protein FAM83H-like [Carassius auratus]|uniref:Protein FAM83H-like n=1 Tax=Carassius auratus TaxID=7957 RepID=A0A6P6QJQ1_CARAU|nr:protein FAM83H-like [Carassius auratus]